MVSGKSCIVLSISHSSSFDRALPSERRSNGPDGQAVDAAGASGTSRKERVCGSLGVHWLVSRRAAAGSGQGASARSESGEGASPCSSSSPPRPAAPPAQSTGLPAPPPSPAWRSSTTSSASVGESGAAVHKREVFRTRGEGAILVRPLSVAGPTERSRPHLGWGSRLAALATPLYD